MVNYEGGIVCCNNCLLCGQRLDDDELQNWEIYVLFVYVYVGCVVY